MSLPMQRQQVLMTMDFDPEFLGDILVTAFDADYGGSWYWAKPDETKETWLETGYVDDPQGLKGMAYNKAWNKVYLRGYRDGEDSGIERVDYCMRNDGAEVNQSMLAQACAKVLQEGSGVEGLGDAITAQDAGDIDAIGADYLVQIALFGEVVYG